LGYFIDLISQYSTDPKVFLFIDLCNHLLVDKVERHQVEEFAHDTVLHVMEKP
jgi:hypothetical protein